MAVLKGMILGAWRGCLAVAVVGALFGYVGGWAPCHGVPFSPYGAYFGALIFLSLFGTFAGIVGAIVGGVVATRERPPVPEVPRRRWSLGRCMVVIAKIALVLALARPFFTAWSPPGDDAAADSATVTPAP